MANMEISPEDREILAKTKFAQWFDENFAEKFGAAFDGRFNDVAALGGEKPQSGTTTSTTQSGKTAEDTSGKKRSLLSMSLEQALGL